jgi:ubiquinone/menaquinone biosynthesis C-methylase UbiE
MIASTLFTWLQEADFYYDLHRQAVEALPAGEGETWLDIGTGPGLVARLAAARGYRATGIDTNPQMIRTARRIAQREHSYADFQTGELAMLPTESAYVVSAASLLAVLPGRMSGLASLWKALKPGGLLLVIEPTDQMTPANAERFIRKGIYRKRILGLRMWTRARQSNIVDPGIYDTLQAASMRFVPLLHGMVGAWIMQKNHLKMPIRA